MNAGYLFIILSWLAVLLIATDWFDPLFAKYTRNSQSKRIAVILLLLILILQGMYVEVFNTIYLNIGAYILLSFLVFFYSRKFAQEYSLQMLSTITFLGIFYAVAYELFFLDPILMVVSPDYLLPCLLMLFTMITVYQLPIQLIVITGGFLLGETLHKLFMFKHLQTIYIGDALFRDQLAIGFFLVILTNGLLLLCTALYSKFYDHVKSMLGTRKRLEKG